MWDKIKALFGGKKAPAAQGDMNVEQDTKHCATCNTQVPMDHAHDATMDSDASMEASAEDAADMNTESDM